MWHISYRSLSIFYKDQNEERPLAKFEHFFLEKFSVSVEIRKTNASRIKVRQNMGTVKPSYCDLLRDSTTVVIDIVINCFSSFYGHF